MTAQPSPNFSYLAHHDARLVALATQAEEHFAGDPSVTLIKLRLFGELLAQRAAAKVAQYFGPEDSQQQLIDRLWERNVSRARRSLRRHAGQTALRPVRCLRSRPPEARVMNDGLDILRERIRAADVPRARRGDSVVIATWNVRELGKSPRRKESLRFIAEVIRSFDLCAVIELREDLTDFQSVLRHLGSSFRAIFSECVRDAGGNRERIAFVYDTRLVEFTGMASHLHPPREKDGDEYLSRVSWWRPPYVASFRSGRLDFVIAAAHIRWGSTIGPRAKEIGLLADWAQRYAASRHTAIRDVLLIGDFNIPSVRSEAYRVLEEREICRARAARGRVRDGPGAGKALRPDPGRATPRRDGARAVHGRGRRARLLRGRAPRAVSAAEQAPVHVPDERPLPLWVELACG